MIYTVVGLQESSGEYNGFMYDNIKLHCVYDSHSNYLTGVGVETITVSKKFIVQNKVPDLLNKEIKVYYNKHGKLTDIIIVE